MKIAVAAMGNTVAGHFGHCENFIFFDTADGAITAVNSVPNPGHRPGFLPNFLADHGAQVIISGGMGGGAVDIFNERGVEVIVGVQGDATAAVESDLKGELVSTGSICHEHEHADECGGTTRSFMEETAMQPGCTTVFVWRAASPGTPSF
ncbi:MAG: NifB/NifX family molybdenum-iron cluster-binding protein [Alitiscatomonas sp.]